jgi:hypothetical protein
MRGKQPKGERKFAQHLQKHQQHSLCLLAKHKAQSTKHKASNNNKKQQVSQYFAIPALYCG